MAGIKIARMQGLMKLVLAGAIACAAGVPAWSSDNQWIKPTPQDLSMTSLPGYPGAPAVILNREEITKDDLHVMLHYERIKILTEKGKERANVELRFTSSKDDGWWSGDEKNITDIQGRTIHSDGTIIPFTGKPYLKTFQKSRDFSYQARVFTLPDVEVGSIIEYRYATRIADNIFESPSWFLQDDLYAKEVHFVWYPTDHELMSHEGMVNTIAWFQILPAGAEVKHVETPRHGFGGGRSQTFEVTAREIPPQPQEDHMPPLASFTYRVIFYYSAYRTPADFWKAKGKEWSKNVDEFAGPNGGLRSATQTVLTGAGTEDAKLRKIYDTVMEFENTDYTRERGKKEDKAEGVGKISNSFDVYKLKRGNSFELTELFVGMARAAGFRAYFMLVPDRSERLFTPDWLSMSQFNNMVAIVNIDGKEKFFEPGSRYCEFGHLEWKSTYVKGLRQAENGTEFAITPGDNYQDSRTQRVGDLTLDEHGGVTGKLTVTYFGAPALVWRQRALRGDEESVRHGLRTSMEEIVPKTLEVKVTDVENLTGYQKPLIAHFEVSGSVGTATGKRMIVPMDIFLADTTGTFPHDKRELPVYFHYPSIMQDAVRVKYPPSMSIEAAPADAKFQFQDAGQYSVTSLKAANSITVRRNLLFNAVIVPVKDYPTLRTFYSEFETRDKDSIVLKAGTQTASTGN